MVSDISRKWIDVGLKISRDPNARVVCPQCEEAILVSDPLEKEGKNIETWIHCPKCKAQNFILHRVANSND